MQAQIQKGALLNEVHLKLTTETIKEITPFGVRAEINCLGEVTGPSYSGRHAETCVSFAKADGTVDWESKSVESTKEGAVVGSAHGTCRITGPDKYEGEGEIVYMTQSPKLSWLNNKKCRIEFKVDFATREAHEKIYAL